MFRFLIFVEEWGLRMKAIITVVGKDKSGIVAGVLLRLQSWV